MIETTMRAKCLIFVLGAMHELRENGMAQGTSLVTPKGIAFFDQLEASGYRPTKAEVNSAVDYLINHPTYGHIDTGSREGIVTLVSSWDKVKELITR